MATIALERRGQTAAVGDIGRRQRDLHTGRGGGDDGLEDAALAAELGIELALGDPGAPGDFQRAGPGIASLHEDREGGADDAVASIGFRLPGQFSSLTRYPWVP
jgi:hypothetical protein